MAKKLGMNAMNDGQGCMECGARLLEEGSTWCGPCLVAMRAGGEGGREHAESEDEGTPLTGWPAVRLLRKIGAGGTGVVWRGEETLPDGSRRAVAAKMLRLPEGTEQGMEERQKRRFLAAADVLRAVEHPGVVRVYGVVAEPGEPPWLVMEYVDGRPLSLWALACGDPRKVLAVLAEVAAAVGHVHGLGVVHRDLKPANVLVTREGKPKVLDFDLARWERGNAAAQQSLTQAGQLLGSVPWMAPEQLHGGKITLATDVFALGVLGCQLLTGAWPHGKVVSMVSHAERLKHEAARVPRTGEEGGAFEGEPVDAGLRAVLARCLELNPLRRYADAAAVASELRRWLDGKPVQSAKLARAAAARRWLWGHRRAATVAAAVTVAFAALSERTLDAVAARNESDRSAQKATAAEKGLCTLLSRNISDEAEKRNTEGDRMGALARLAEALRLEPENAGAAQRAQALLLGTPFLLPLGPEIAGPGGGAAKWAAFDARGERLLLGGATGAAAVEVTEGMGVARDFTGEASSCGAFSPDGKWLVLGHADGRISLREAKGGMMERAFWKGGREWRQAEWSVDARLLALVDVENKATLLEWRNGRLTPRWQDRNQTGENRWENPEGAERRVSFSADGRFFISSQQNLSVAEAVGLESSIPQTREFKLSAGDGMISSCVALAEGAGIVCGGTAGALMFAPADGQTKEWKVPSRQTVVALAAARDAPLVAAATFDGTIYIYKMQGGEPELLEERRTGVPLSSLVLAANGAWLAALGRDGEVYLWPGGLRNTGLAPHRLRAAAGKQLAMRFSPRGDALACLTDAGGCAVWDLRQRMARPSEAAQGARQITFCAGGSRLAGLSSDGKDLILWQAEDAAELGRWPHGLQGEKSPGPDKQDARAAGEILPAGDDWICRQAADGKLAWHHAADGRSASETSDVLAAVEALRFSDSGQWAAVADAAQMVRVYAAGSAVPLAAWKTEAPVRKFCWSSSGRRLVWWGEDNQKFYAAEISGGSPTQAGPLKLAARGRPAVAAFHPDGEWLAAADTERSLRVWRMRETGERILQDVSLAGVPAAMWFREAEDGVRLQLLYADGAFEERRWDDLTLPLEKRKAEPGAKITSTASAAGLRAWIGGGKAGVFDGQTARGLSEAPGRQGGALSVALAPDGRRVAVSGGTTFIWDLPAAEGTAPAWFPMMLDYLSGQRYDSATMEMTRVDRPGLLAQIIAAATGDPPGYRRLREWFLQPAGGSMVSPFSGLSAEELIARWLRPEDPRRQPGESLPTPAPPAAPGALPQQVREVSPDHTLVRLAEKAESPDISTLPAPLSPPVLLRCLELLHRRGHLEPARVLAARDLSSAMTAVGGESRMARALQTMSAFLQPESAEAAWWLALDAGWMPEGAWPVLRRALAEAEGWQQSPPKLEAAPAGQGLTEWTATLNFTLTRLDLLTWLRLAWPSSSAPPGWSVNGVALAGPSSTIQDHEGILTGGTGRSSALTNAIPVRRGHNEVIMTFRTPSSLTETQIGRCLGVEHAEAPLVRLLACRLAAGSLPEKSHTEPAWHEGIARSRARIAQVTDNHARARRVVAELIPPTSELAAPRLDEDAEKLGKLAFLPLLTALEAYPMKGAGVELRFVLFASQRIKSAAILACQEGRAEEVRAAIPRIVELGRASTEANPGQAAAFLEITSSLIRELEAMTEKFR